MKTAEDICKDIVNGLFNNPKLGENYTIWETESGECGLTVIFKHQNKQFDIIVKEKEQLEMGRN